MPQPITHSFSSNPANIPPRRRMAYVGSRTTRERNARGEGLSVYEVDAQTGRLHRQQIVRDLVNPSYLALNEQGTRLYTVHGDQSEVSVLAVDPGTGLLTHLQQISCGGKNPVHLALAPHETHLLISNHLSGLVSVLPILPHGKLGPVCQQIYLPGEPGPHRLEQPFSKPHFNPFTPDGRHVIVPDKGLDRVFSYTWEYGKLTPTSKGFYTAREGSGPRNIAFHPTAPWAYVVNELDSTVTACLYSPGTGELRPQQILSLLPDNFTGNSRAACIAVSTDGKTLYASNRGHDSVSIFRIDNLSGRLSWVMAMPSGGRTPRFFVQHPDQPWLYVLNETSDALVQFEIAANGLLNEDRLSIETCGSPVCMVIA